MNVNMNYRKQSEGNQRKNLQRLKALMDLRDNKRCAECPEPSELLPASARKHPKPPPCGTPCCTPLCTHLTHPTNLLSPPFICTYSCEDPDWASINLGVFVCLRCSGLHRQLGVHVSKVKSATLDLWNTGWVKVMRSWGNRRANLYYHASLPKSNRLPSVGVSDAELLAYLKDKYELKKWASRLPAAKWIDRQAEKEAPEEEEEE